MTKLSLEVFCEIMNKLSEAYEKNIPKERANIYYDALKDDFDDEDMQRMLPIVLQTCRYFPTVADIVNAIRDIDYLPKLEPYHEL
jgi:hypothetical protein